MPSSRICNLVHNFTEEHFVPALLAVHHGSGRVGLKGFWLELSKWPTAVTLVPAGSSFGSPVVGQLPEIGVVENVD